MNTLKTYILLIGLLGLLTPLIGQDYSQPVIPLDSIYQVRLENELTLLVVEDHQAPRVLMGLFYPQQMDSVTIIGELINQALISGNTEQTIDSLKLEMEKKGIILDASPIGIRCFTTPNQADSTLKYLSEIISNEDFNDLKIQALKSRLRNDLLNKSNLAIAGSISNQLFQINNDTYLPNVDSASCSRFYKTLYQPDQCVLVVVGDVDPQLITSSTRKRFSPWKKDTTQLAPAAFLGSNPVQRPSKVFVHYTNSNLPTYLQVILPLQITPGSGLPHYTELLNTIVGGHPKSRLNQQLRAKQGYSFGMLSKTRRTPSGQSILTIQGGIKSNQIDSAIVNILRVVHDVRTNKVTSKELDLVKKISTTNFSRKIQQTQNVVDLIYHQWENNLPLNELATFSDSIRSINSVDLMENAYQMLQPDSAIIIAVGNREELEQPLLALDSNLVICDEFGLPVQLLEAKVPEDLKVQKVFKKYLNSVGTGLLADSVKSISTKWISQIEGSKVELQMKIVKPNKLLIDVLLDGKPMSTTKFYNGKLWTKNLGGSSTISDSIAIQQYQQQALIFPEIQFDSTFLLKGIENIKGVEAYRIESPSGNIYHYDTNKGYKIQTIHLGREGQRITQFFSNYRRVKDIRYPHTAIIDGLTGWPLEFNLEELEINPILADDIFRIDE